MDDPGAHGIQVDIPNDLYQIAIRRYETSVIPALEEMPRRRNGSLVVTRVPTGDRVDHAPERSFIHACEQVDVIGHPAVGMQADVMSLCGFADDGVELVAIVRRPEDRFAMVTAKGHMVEPTRYVDAGCTWHGAGLSRKDAPELPRTRVRFLAATAANAVRVV
jgi:hypothetical protein